MNRVFAPGCALEIYKAHLANQLSCFLNKSHENIPTLKTCCQHEPNLQTNTCVINVCAGCDRRYRSLYEGITTISLWEILADDTEFKFPNYHGQKMSIHDACPVRTEQRVHIAVRKLLERMNIQVIEPTSTKENSICCGDSFYGKVEISKVKKQMVKRASEMPCDDVVVYCVSCIKSMHLGGKKPRYLIDLLYEEPTQVQTFEPELWHKELDDYIEAH